MTSSESKLMHSQGSPFATVMGVAGLVLVLKTMQVPANGSVFQPD